VFTSSSSEPLNVAQQLDETTSQSDEIDVFRIGIALLARCSDNSLSLSCSTHQHDCKLSSLRFSDFYSGLSDKHHYKDYYSVKYTVR